MDGSAGAYVLALSLLIPYFFGSFLKGKADMLIFFKWVSEETPYMQKRPHQSKVKTRPDTRLPKSRAGGQGPYLRSLDHLGRSSVVIE